MPQVIYNNRITKTSAAITAVATSIPVQSAAGFPDPGTDYYFATLAYVEPTSGKENDWEIVKVTSVTANNITVERAQEGTTARAWDAFTPFEVRITAGTLTMPDATQTVTNKTIQSSTIDSTPIGGSTASTASFTDLTATGTVSLPATNVTIGNVDSTEIGYLNGVSSAIQTQLDTKYEAGDSPTFTDITADTLQFTGGTGAQGTLSWNADEETVDLIQDGAVLQLGQEVHYHVRNNTGQTIANGTPVMATGTLGSSGRITVAPMDGTDFNNEKFYLGVATEDITTDTDGKVTYFGKVRGVDLSAYTDGDVLWLSTSNAGEFTLVEPDVGIKLAVAYVIHAAVNGTMFVRFSTSVGLHDLHDVWVNAVGDKEVLQYDSVNERWENKTLAEAGITLDGVTDAGNTTTNGITVGSATVTNALSAGSATVTGNLTVDTNTLFVDSSSNEVGIGVNPAAKFHVKTADTSGSTLAFFDDSGSGSVGRLQIQTSGGTGSDFVEVEAVNRNLKLGPTTANQGVHILSDGKVGIGTNNPSEALDVTGNIVASGRLRAKDGSVGDVGIGFGADHNLGFIRPASDTLGIVTGSTERVRVTATGNVGIGDSAPDDILHVRVGNYSATNDGGIRLTLGDSATDHYAGRISMKSTSGVPRLALDAPSDSSGNTLEAVTIGSAGNVGIGTASPAQNLEVSGSNARVRVTDSDSVAASATAFYELYGTDARVGTLYTSGGNTLLKADSGSLGFDASGDVYVDAGAAWQTYTGVGNFQINSAGNAGLLIHTGNTSTGYITFGDGAVAGRITYNHASNAMQFGTSDGTADITLDSSGRFGIGTASPSTELHLVGSTPQLRMSPTVDTENCRVEFTNAARVVQSWIDGGGSNGRDMRFIDGPSSTVNMIIKGDTGNVGIGTTSPAAELEAAGAVRSSRDGVASQFIEMEAFTSRILAESSAGNAKSLSFSCNTTDLSTPTSGSLGFLWRINDVTKMNMDQSGNVFVASGSDFGVDGTTFYVDASTNRVGIGTDSPSSPLHVIGSNAQTARIESTGTNAAIVYAATTGSWQVGQNPTGNFTFYDVDGAITPFVIEKGAATSTLVVDSNSKVGINTTSPYSKLDVNDNQTAAYSTTIATTGGVPSGVEISNIINGDTSSTNFKYALQGWHVAASTGQSNVFGRQGLVRTGSNTSAFVWQLRTTTDTTNTTEMMRITNEGNVGIGDNDPDFKLCVTSNIDPATTSPFDNSSSMLRLENSNTSANSYTTITFSGVDDTGVGRHAASISMLKNGTWTAGSGNYSGSLIFSTRPTSGNQVERVRIDSSGNVGIGTDTPSHKFEVREDVANNPTVMACYNQGNFGGAQLKLGSDSTQSATIFGLPNPFDANATDLIFRIYDGTTNLEAMRIKGNGNVGIGSFSPQSTLEIAKDDRVTGPVLSITSKTDASDWASGDKLGRIDFRTGDFSLAGGGEPVRARIECLYGEFSSGDYVVNSDLAFYTASVNTLAERMRIDANGKVGIGRTPSVRLDVTGPVDTTFAPNIYNFRLRGESAATSGSAGAGISFSGYYNATSDADLAFVSGVKENTANNNYAGALVLGTRPNGSGGGSMERMRIDSVGRLGINNNNPTYTLDVKNTGTAYAPVARFTDNGEATNWARIDIKNNNATDNTGLLLYQDQAGNAAIRNDNSSGTIRAFNFIAGNTTAGYFNWQNTASGAVAMALSSTGNLGLGETNPIANIHIKASNPNIRFVDSDDNGISTIEGGAGSIIINADRLNTLGSSEIQLRVDGSDALILNGTGATLFGNLDAEAVDTDTLTVGGSQTAKYAGGVGWLFSSDATTATDLTTGSSDGIALYSSGRLLVRSATGVDPVRLFMDGGSLYVQDDTDGINVLSITKDLKLEKSSGQKVTIGSSYTSATGQFLVGYTSSTNDNTMEVDGAANFKAGIRLNAYFGASAWRWRDAGRAALWVTNATDTIAFSAAPATGSTAGGDTSSVDIVFLEFDTGAGTPANARLLSPAVRDATTGSAANVFIDSTSGALLRVSSSIRYKTDVQDAPWTGEQIDALRPVTFRGINDGDTVFGGLIAEEVHDAGLTEFVVYNEEDRPESLHYGHMVALCIKEIQSLRARVAQLEAANG